MDTRCMLVRVERQDIGLLCGLMAAYEGVAIVRTLDPQQGLVELLVAPAFYTTALSIMQALAQEMSLCLLTTGAEDVSQGMGSGAEPGAEET